MEKQFLGKLSVGTVVPKANIKKNIPEAGQAPFGVMEVFGKATGLKGVEDKVTGVTHTAIVGEFEAVRMDTGEIFSSGVLYLPPGMHDRICAVFSGENPPSQVKFALEIAIAAASNPAGYSWVGKELIEPIGEDPLSDIRSAITAKRQALLEAPKAEHKEKAKA